MIEHTLSTEKLAGVHRTEKIASYSKFAAFGVMPVEKTLHAVVIIDKWGGHSHKFEVVIGPEEAEPNTYYTESLSEAIQRYNEGKKS